jgi:hypothetical protein
MYPANLAPISHPGSLETSHTGASNSCLILVLDHPFWTKILIGNLFCYRKVNCFGLCMVTQALFPASCWLGSRKTIEFYVSEKPG